MNKDHNWEAWKSGFMSGAFLAICVMCSIIYLVTHWTR
jgi:hypothetical protein